MNEMFDLEGTLQSIREGVPQDDTETKAGWLARTLHAALLQQEEHYRNHPLPSVKELEELEQRKKDEEQE